MVETREIELSDAETDAFLSRCETGVLSLARGDEPYAIPISYGYDADSRQIYLRLVSAPDSEKRAFLTSEPAARLVVYDGNDEGTRYTSAIVEGTLVQIDESELTVELLEQYGRTKRPLFEIWGPDKPDLNIKLYRLDPETVSGRRAEVDRSDEGW